MDRILSVVASNTIVAALLTCIILSLTRFWRSPQLAHALWLLVLLKLVAPPIASVPLPGKWYRFPSSPDRPVLVSSVEDLSPQSGPITDGKLRASADGMDVLSAGTQIDQRVAQGAAESDIPGRELPRGVIHLPSAPNASSATSLAETSISVEPPATEPDDSPLLPPSRSTSHLLPSNEWPFVLVAWLAGSALYAALLAWRCVGFRKVLARANDADAALLADAQRLAHRMDIRRPPIVRVVDAGIPPLVWSMGRRPLVLLPQVLMRVLDRVQQQAVLAHELAHIRRRDDWVRWLEVVVLVLFWWNPVAWFARHRLRRAEEECCDAWVVWALPDDRSSYGRALLMTLEFLNQGPTPLGTVAGSTFGQFLFKRRIEVILKRKMNRKMSWFAFSVVLLIAVLVMPVASQTSRVGDAARGRDDGDPRPQVEDSPVPAPGAVDTPALVDTPAPVDTPALVDAPALGTVGTEGKARGQDTTVISSYPNEDAARPTPHRPDLEQRIQHLEAIVKTLERQLAQRPANDSPLPTGRYAPAPVAPPAKPNSRGAVISKDHKLIVVLNSDEETCELDAFDAFSGRLVWKSELSLPHARDLRISDDGKTLCVFSNSQMMMVTLANGRLIPSSLQKSPLSSQVPQINREAFVNPLVDTVEQRKGHVRLLELDVKAAKLKIDAARIKLRQLQRSNADESEIAQAEIAIQQAELDLERAETTLDLNQKAPTSPSPPARARR